MRSILLHYTTKLLELLQELLKHEAALDQELALVQRYGVKELLAAQLSLLT